MLSTYSKACPETNPRASDKVRLVLTNRLSGKQKQLVTAGTPDTYLRMTGSDDRWDFFYAHSVIRVQLADLDSKAPKMKVLAVDPYPP